MKYALIKNKTIKNIIVADYTMANMLAQQSGHIAVNVDNYPVGIGDIYENECFMNAEDVKDKDGNILVPARTVIERRMTDEEYIYKLEQENKELGQFVTDLELQILMMEAGK